MAKPGKSPKDSSKKGPARSSRAPSKPPSPPKRTAPKAAAKADKEPRKKEVPAPVRVRAPFSDAELAHFRQLLLDRRSKLLANVTSMEAEALKASDQDFSVDHMADHGSDNFEQDFTLALVESERKELFEISQALERIRAGTYGICEGTGKPIAKPRLEAIPYARYSIEYQRRIEAGEVEEDESRTPIVLKRERSAAAANILTDDTEQPEYEREEAEQEEEREEEHAEEAAPEETFEAADEDLEEIEEEEGGADDED